MLFSFSFGNWHIFSKRMIKWYELGTRQWEMGQCVTWIGILVSPNIPKQYKYIIHIFIDTQSEFGEGNASILSNTPFLIRDGCKPPTKSFAIERVVRVSWGGGGGMWNSTILEEMWKYRTVSLLNNFLKRSTDLHFNTLLLLSFQIPYNTIHGIRLYSFSPTVPILKS